MCLFGHPGQAHGVEGQAKGARPAEENQLEPIHTQCHRFLHGGVRPEGGNFIRNGQTSRSYYELPQRNQLLQRRGLQSHQQEATYQNEIGMAQPYHLQTGSSCGHLQGHHRLLQIAGTTGRKSKK